MTFMAYNNRGKSFRKSARFDIKTKTNKQTNKIYCHIMRKKPIGDK